MFEVANWNATTWALVATAAFTGVVALGVLLAWKQLRDTRKTRDAEIVHKLMQQWDSPRMIEAKRLIASYTGRHAVERMAEDFKQADARQTGDFFLFTYHLNFWEQVSLSYGDDRTTLRLIDTIFGDELWRAWANWQPVLELRYGPNSNVGGKFRATFKKLQRQAKWRLRRHEVRYWLWTPRSYYRVPKVERKARRDAWKLKRTQ